MWLLNTFKTCNKKISELMYNAVSAALTHNIYNLTKINRVERPLLTSVPNSHVAPLLSVMKLNTFTKYYCRTE